MRPERVLVLGCGSVAQCTLPLLIRDLAIDPRHITIVDMVDNRARVADSIALGVTYQQYRVTPDNIDAFLSASVGHGDLLLDLAWNIDNPTILQWCRDYGVRYLNTSVEVWDPYHDMASTHPLDRTLYVRHMDLRRMIAGWGDNNGATAVVEHGANPGLVSHFTKQALTEIATRMLHDGLAADAVSLESALANDAYDAMAMLTGTKVIHVAERDSQTTNVPKEVDEFVNTWSVDGFYEEGIAPAELGWGTHEKRLPPNAYVHHGYGPCNQICIARPGMETWVRSWVPTGEIRGMVVRHGEALTISDHLTVWGDDGNAIYRPTVHYGYCPSDAAISSVLELRMRNWQMQSRQRILNDEIISGRDELGVLLMGHPYRSWWTGSLLSIDEARAIVAHQSATTLQVAGSIIATVTWMIEHPNAGVCVPDDLPWREVLDVASRYLGTMQSAPADWDPLTTRNDLFPGFANDADGIDRIDPWQFSNFLVT
ncbi:MAG: saccharopine dehydrogenase NADP-binding domain-containing protein [Actinomycetota bacterium]|nr:saccharopine dehydrogenase NADP-binding domain-containing protein [Actinomycetota bacterium]